MTALDLIAADPSLLMRAALDQIRALLLETDRQQATILAQREELRALSTGVRETGAVPQFRG